MSTTIEINGVNLISVKEATSLVSYSKDYIGRLAREGKIVASQVGRQWFVDVESLKNFSESAALVEEARKLELRAERKRELQANESMITLEGYTRGVTKRHKREAAVITVATLCLGLFVGLSVYTASFLSLPGNTSILAVVSSALTQSSEPAPLLPVEPVPTPTLLYTEVTEYPTFETVSETRALAKADQGLLLLPRTGSVTDAEAVAALFSDEVTVTFETDTTGTIYTDQGTELPFVTVPVKEAEPDVAPPTE